MRDVCVLDVDLTCWQRLLDALPGFGSQVEVTVEPEALRPEVFANAELLFRLLGEGGVESASLSFMVGRVRFACYFFDVDEIEFTFHPEDIFDEASFACLEAFMERLAEVCENRVVMNSACMPTLYGSGGRSAVTAPGRRHAPAVPASPSNSPPKDPYQPLRNGIHQPSLD